MKSHAFKFLKEIYYVRTAGSDAELKAANQIKDEVKRLGGLASFEEFEVDHSKVIVSTLTVDGHEIECAGSGYSGCTEDEGVTGDFYYADQLEAANIINLKDKIILSNTKRVPHQLYEKAVTDKALGFILTTGSVYKKSSEVDLDPYLTRELDYSIGQIPTVMIKTRDAEKILEKEPKKATIVLKCEDDKLNLIM